jgi:hypothetical protein
MNEAIEKRIRAVLATETNAMALSYQLFRQGGLFSQMASTQEERKALVRTPLYKEAQARLNELQEADRAAMITAADRLRAAQKATTQPAAPSPTCNGPTAQTNGAPAESPARSDAAS